MKKTRVYIIVAAIFIVVVFSILLLVASFFIAKWTLIDSIGTKKTEKYLESIENQENSQQFFHLGVNDFEANLNNAWIDSPALKTPTSYFDCYFFGATDEELFYYVETAEGVDFYKSNYTNYTYEMTRSFNYEEILYHKCDELIYLGKDGKTHVFDGFELTDEIYEGEIPTYTPKYTVTKEKKDFVIKDNETGEEKRISDLKKDFRKNEHVKHFGIFANINYVFEHNEKIYVVYDVYDLMVVFELDFGSGELVLKNWSWFSGSELFSTWYLDRVKFAE